MSQIPFSQRMVQGAIGKRCAIKHYQHGIVKTKYPDASGIVPSRQQKVSRRLFRLAVQFAQRIYQQPELKAEWRRKLHRPKRLFQALMKQFYKQRQQRQAAASKRIKHWRRNVLGRSSTIYLGLVTAHLLLQGKEERLCLPLQDTGTHPFPGDTIPI